MPKLCESDIEKLAIDELENLGYTYIPGPGIAPDGETPERQSYGEVLLVDRVRLAMARFNPTVPPDAREDALKQLLRLSSSDLIANNEQFHRFLTEGVDVEYRKNGEIMGDKVWLVDFEHPENNEFLAVNQFTVIENNRNKRPDVVLFINGLPLVVMELKNAADENATINKAYEQVQTYKATIPTLFTYNELIIVSDGLEAKAGSLSADFSRFMAWKTRDGLNEAPRHASQLETLIHGMLKKEVITDLIRHFIVFEKSKTEDKQTGLVNIRTVKKIAAYHQYYAVNKAVKSTLKAAAEGGSKKGGVIWHTQGSGKSLTMVFYTGKLVQLLYNPTVVVITDRNDLDDQLFDTFAASAQLLKQPPVQAESREHLKDLLRVASGGIIFTTIQKFLPEDNKTEFDLLSERRNIVVIADEAHRTQYGFNARIRNIKDENRSTVGQKITYGFAKYMRDALPNATYIGFTGTPIEKEDVNTPAVFGDYIDIYDIAQAVEDGATVRIYYESRLARVNLDEEGRRLIEEFDAELEETDEVSEAQKAKAKWAKLEAIVGHPKRIANLARDIVEHFEARQAVFAGKGMIVAMSRRIAVDLYNEIVKLRPQWHHDDLDKGVIKVVMTTTSSDGVEMQRHHTTKAQRKMLAERMKDENDPLKLVIVRDMWLTGFDVPCLHTMYIDKPMKDHNLMQAIARVNRVFKDKPGGLVVDYIGIGPSLKKALSFYSNAGGKGSPAETQEKAVDIMLEKLEVVRQMYHGFDYSRYFAAPTGEKLSYILRAEEHVLSLEDGKARYIKEVTLLSRAHALATPHPQTREHAEEIAFFQAVKARLVKFESGGAGGGSGWETTIKQIVDEALSSEQVIDIFAAAGMEKPEISILSEEFLEEVKNMKHKNLAIELLKKLLNDEIKERGRQNYVVGKSLMQMLETAIKKYQNNLLTTAEIIEELIRIAKEINAADRRGEDLGLSKDELAFYDALGVNDSAVKVLGDETLRHIARELADKVRRNATIDWTVKESVRARLMVLVRRTLNKYGYPPDKQRQAVETVMKQAEILADKWAASEMIYETKPLFGLAKVAEEKIGHGSFACD
ncbi:type I restriction endonuclease subunit R [Thermincola ferriacetica]